MIIVGKSMPIENYEQYKRVINHWETIYIRERDRHTHTHTHTHTNTHIDIDI